MDNLKSIKYILIFILCNTIFLILLIITLTKAGATEMTATVEKSDYYKCLEECELKCYSSIDK